MQRQNCILLLKLQMKVVADCQLPTPPVASKPQDPALLLLQILLYVHRDHNYGLLGTVTCNQDVHLDFHTAPELCPSSRSSSCNLYLSILIHEAGLWFGKLVLSMKQNCRFRSLVISYLSILNYCHFASPSNVFLNLLLCYLSTAHFKPTPIPNR